MSWHKTDYEAAEKKALDEVNAEYNTAKTFTGAQWKVIGVIVVICVVGAAIAWKLL